MAGGLDRGTCAGSVEALLVVGGEAYAGGYFFAPDSTLSIARWDGSWHSVGGGVSGSLQQVYALAGINGELFVGVAFDHAGGAAGFNYIATWNGVAWSALGSGLNNFVYALATKGTRVYVGGRFTTAGGVSANRIAYWPPTLGGGFWREKISASLPRRLRRLLRGFLNLTFAAAQKPRS